MTDQNSEEITPKPELHTDDVASFLDLQTEFIRRRNAVITSGKSQTRADQIPTNYVHKTKNNILAISKEEKRTKNEIATQRAQRIRQNEEAWRKEEQQRERQKQILEQKAAIYERMARGERLVYEDGKEADFLVDFQSKNRELEEEQKRRPEQGFQLKDNHGNITDKELRRSDDERERKFDKTPAPLIIHYDPTEEKGRVFGASHVILPTMDEDEREKKIAELKSMTEQTNLERAKRKRQKDAKKTEDRQRLNRLRERMGLKPIESSDEEEQTPDETTSKQAESIADIPLPEEMSVKDAPKEEKMEPDEKKPKKYGVREWDRGKVGYRRWVEAQREERDNEFAPPSFYYQHNNNKR